MLLFILLDKNRAKNMPDSHHGNCYCFRDIRFQIKSIGPIFKNELCFEFVGKLSKLKQILLVHYYALTLPH